MTSLKSKNYQYQVGGSLRFQHPTYVTRLADTQLLAALKSGEFCYVLNSRQMGKSSLRVRTMRLLKAQKFRCAAIDLTRLGSAAISSKQWYRGIISELERSFRLFGKIEKQWWQDNDSLSSVQLLSRFIEDILLVQIPEEKIVIFLDEIDSVISLDFKVDDFFALIRSCYNQRVDNPEYERLTFCLLGVATPSNLIQDTTKTAFNIGQAIELTGFSEIEAQPLMTGLENSAESPKAILKEILFWTGGQPFLTQKLCKLLAISGELIETGQEKEAIASLVQSKIINNWEVQDEPVHLRTLQDRLLKNENHSEQLLRLYQRILQQGKIKADSSLAQQELRLSGLVVRQDSFLIVYNPIYHRIFNLAWVDQELNKRRPYSEAIKAWEESQRQDPSRLLRGKALEDALTWAINQNLPPQDYQFLNASQALEQHEMEIRWQAERSQRRKYWLGIISSALVISVALGMTAFYHYRKALRSQLNTQITSSEALFASNQTLDALVEAIKAQKQLSQLRNVNIETQNRLNQALQQAIYGVEEFNRLSGHSGWIYGITISPNGEWLASGSSDSTIKLWKNNGKLIQTLRGHNSWVYDVAISPDSDWLASASADNTIKLWDKNGQLLRTLIGHESSVYDVEISHDGNLIVSGSEDNTIKVWNKDGKLISTLQGHQEPVWGIAISPTHDLIVSASADNTIKLWNIDGTLINTLEGHRDEVRAVAISSDGSFIASASQDSTIKLWNLEGQLIATLDGHDAAVYGIAISPDSSWLASASADNTVKIWHRNGTLLKTLEGHSNRVWSVDISPDGAWLASASWDQTIKLWRQETPLLQALEGHTDVVIEVSFSGNGQTIASASDDKTVMLWDSDGNLINTFDQHQGEVYDIALNERGDFIVSASKDKTLKLWDQEGNVIQTLNGHKNEVWGVAIDPKEGLIVSGSKDKTVRLWNLKGELLSTLRGHKNVIWDVAIQGDLIASASADKTVKLWDTNGNLLHTLEGHTDEVWDVAIQGDLIASASADKTVKLWRRNGKLLHTLRGHQSVVKGIAISSDAQLIASASDDKTIKLWNANGELIKTLKGHNATVWSVAISPNQQILASVAEDRKVMLWDLPEILKLNEVEYACHWVRDYLQYNLERQGSGQKVPKRDHRVALRDRNLCD